MGVCSEFDLWVSFRLYDLGIASIVATVAIAVALTMAVLDHQTRKRGGQ